MPPPNSAFTGFRSPISSAPRRRLQGAGTRPGTWLRAPGRDGGDAPRAGDVAGSLPLVGGGDEEGVDAGVLVVPDLHDELGDAEADVVEQPEQRVVVRGVWGRTAPLAPAHAVPVSPHPRPSPCPHRGYGGCEELRVPSDPSSPPLPKPEPAAGTPRISLPGKVISTSQFSVGTVFIQALWDMM